MPKRRPFKALTDEKAIGRRLREARDRRGVTQVQIAERLGLDQPLISGYERGTVRMHAALVATLAKALGASADEILGIKKAKGNSVRSRALLRRLPEMDRLPARDMETLIKTIDTFLKAARSSSSDSSRA